MIKLDAVVITNFRGIKNLSLELSQNNFAICGPNGTGKSGIVDAIEFALTGSITRLTGRGSGELSVKDHAPHVDLRNEPSKATVNLSLYSPTLHKTFILERSVGKPKQPTIRPNDPDILALVKRLEKHPELALSRREIVKYIIAEPGARSEEVQALLKLEEIGKLRKALTSVVGSLKREVQSAEDALSEARAQLLSGLKIAEVKSAFILDAVNVRRALLAAEPLATLEKDTNLKAGIEPLGKKSSGPLLSKGAATADIESFRRFSLSLQSPDFLAAAARVTSILESLEANPALLRDLKHHSLLQKGLELLESDECPLCGTHWEIEELRRLLQERLGNARLAGDLQVNLQRELDALRKPMLDVIGLGDLIYAACQPIAAGKRFRGRSVLEGVPSFLQ